MCKIFRAYNKTLFYFIQQNIMYTIYKNSDNNSTWTSYLNSATGNMRKIPLTLQLEIPG